MTTLIEKSILNERLEKSRSGTYADTSENRRKHRVGQKYGSEKKEEEKPEKTSSNEKDPAKELEAVDKVIAAINEGKLKLPQEEIMVLIEKKNNLELAKRQAEKINAGVKANEEKRNAKEIKETNKKINEASKQKKYGDMNVEEAKKELLGKDLTVTDIETGKTRTEKITSILEGNVRGHETVMARVEGGGTYPIKQINTGKEWKAWKLSLDSETKEPEKKETPKEKASKSEVASDGKSIQKRKIELLDKYHEDLEKMNKAHEQEQDRIMKELDDEVDSKKRKELWTSLKEKTNNHNEATNKLWKEYESNLDKLEKDEDAHYDKLSEKEKDEVLKFKGEKPKESQKSEYFDRTGYKPIYRMNEEEADKFISDAKKYLSENKDAKDVEQVQDAIRKVELRKEEIKETSNEEAEVYTRIKFEDVPNSGKINLKKYLSEKVRKGVDEKWSNIKNIPTENLKKMEKGLVNDLNKNFEAIKKSQRAELLYSIMKVKGELEKRGKESQKKE